MTKTTVISQKEARTITLNAQGLTSNIENSLDIIKQLTYIQIDTISVTERAHNHVYFSRNPSFKQEEISDLMENKSIFEYWSHAAAYLPMDDFRFSLYRKEQYKSNRKHWFPRDKKVEKYVMDRIKSEGPLQSKDFESAKNNKPVWYEWKPSKIALSNLFMDGSIMIKNRKGFHKIFDITESVIPATTNTNIPSADVYYKHLIMNAIKSHGLVSLNEICYLRRGVKTDVKKIINDLIEDNLLVQVSVDDHTDLYYSTVNTLTHLNTNFNQIHILSPFDNLVIQRKRVKNLFNFDYQIECYVPEKKRKFGYYCLPVLYKDQFIARLDAKADRKSKLFTIKGIWFEKGFIADEEFLVEFSKRIKSFSSFCGCNSITIKEVSPPSFKNKLTVFI